MQSLFWLLVWLLLFGGVSTSVYPATGGEQPSAAEAPARAQGKPSAGAPTLLDFGASTTVQNGNLTVTFSEVVEDSRCPSEVSCVWSGMAVVALDAQVTGHTAHTVHVGGVTSNHGVVEGPVPAHHVTHVATIDGYDVQLLAVTPYPAKAGAPPDKSEYQVQLLVRESDSGN